jgi:hypothetical protein
MKKVAIGWSILIVVVILLSTLLLIQGFMFTKAAFVLASSGGIYPTAETGSIHQVQNGFQGIEKIKIDYAGPASFDGSQPHVWYVGWTVWAEKDEEGNPVRRALTNYRRGGGYWLHTKEGWVQMPEGAFPGFIGFWMRVYGFAGPGQRTPFAERPGATVFDVDVDR